MARRPRGHVRACFRTKVPMFQLVARPWRLLASKTDMCTSWAWERVRSMRKHRLEGTRRDLGAIREVNILRICENTR
eukprot:8591428-Alexandrium_andersonii.AAC.1